MKKSHLTVLAVTLAITAAALGLLQRLLVPKYENNIVEGNFISEYYRDRTKHDVIFLGDSNVYSDISTVELWKKYGITSYTRGSSDQMLSQSYYILKDTFETELPQTVVFDVSSMTRTELKKDAFNRITMDGMRWSLNKIKAIRAGMIKGEHFLDYVFPILRFHSRWNDLTADDFRYLFSRPSVSYNGYYLRADVKTTTTYPPDHKQKNMTFNAVNAEYLQKIADLCREKNVTLILIKSPSRYPAWYDEWDSQISDFASANGIRYFNFAKVKDEIGIDYETDTYDGGLHLNVSGAEKVADYFGNILSSEYGLTDHRSDSAVKAYWEEMTERYESERKAQEAEFAELGYVSRYRNTDTETQIPDGSSAAGDSR